MFTIEKTDTTEMRYTIRAMIGLQADKVSKDIEKTYKKERRRVVLIKTAYILIGLVSIAGYPIMIELLFRNHVLAAVMMVLVSLVMIPAERHRLRRVRIGRVWNDLCWREPINDIATVVWDFDQIETIVRNADLIDYFEVPVIVPKCCRRCKELAYLKRPSLGHYIIMRDEAGFYTIRTESAGIDIVESEDDSFHYAYRNGRTCLIAVPKDKLENICA